MFGKKKNDKVKFDEYDFDDELEFDSGYDDPFTPSADRSPATDFGKGAYEGVKETMKSPGFYGNVMRKALPDGYSNAFDVVDDIAGRSQGLYNEVSSELRPAVRNVKRVLHTAKRAVDSIIPDTLSKKLDEWLEDKEVDPRKMEVDAQETRIATDLAGIFKAQAEVRQDDKAEQMIDRVVENDRSQSLMQQLTEIRGNLSRMVSYQDSILISYQKKSLELKYRMFFLTTQLVDVAKATSADTIGLLKTIMKNTALPEYQKITQAEKFSELARERLFGVVQNRFADNSRDFLDKFFTNVRGKIMETVDNFKMGAESAMQGADQMSIMGDMAGGMEDLGMSKANMAGQMAGSMGANEAGQWFGKKFLKPALEKNPGIVAGGYGLDYLSRDFDELLKNWADDNTMSGGIKGFFADTISETMARKRNNVVGGDDILKAADPAIWDNLSRKSLVEIIPGYLSKMLLAIEQQRDPDAGMQTYDYRTNQFTSVDNLASRIKQEATKGYEYDSLKSRTQQVVQTLDKDKTLSEEQSISLQTGLLKHAKDGRGFSPKTFTDSSTFVRLGMSPTDAESIAQLFTDKLKMDDRGLPNIKDPEAMRFLNTISREIRDIKDALPNPTEMANIYANTGNREAIRRTGLVQRDTSGIERIDDRFVISSFDAKLRGKQADETTSSETPISRDGFTPYHGAGPSTMAPGADSLRDAPVFGEMRDLLREMVSSYKETTRVSESEATRNDPYSNERLDLLINTLREQSVTKQADESLTLLNEIREAILQLNESVVNMDGPGGGDRGPRKTWKSRAKGFGSAVLKPFKTLYGLGGKFQDGVIGAGKKVFNRGMDAVRAVTGFAKSKMPSDVFVWGKIDPALREADMRAGFYVDAITGEVIKSVGDIKGAVRDLRTGKIVLTAEEFSKGLFDNNGKQLAKGMAGWAKEKIAKAFGFVTGELGKGFKLPFTLLGKGYDKAKSLFFQPPDVYVPGEKTPRLLGSVLLRGSYFSSKTGKPIFSLKDVDSDIMDADGNVKLTLDEIAKGVVDKDGKPIRSLMDKIKGLIKKGFEIGVGIVGWGARQLKKGLGDVRGLASKLNPMNWKMPGGMQDSQGKVVQSIDRIYALLVKYFVMQGMDPSEAEAAAEVVAANAKATVTAATDTVKTKATAAKDNLAGKVSKLAEKAKAAKEEAMDQAKSKFQEIRDRTAAQREKIADKLKRKKESMQERGGSWLNILAARKAKKKESDPDKGNDGAEKKRTGLLGMLLKFVSPIAGILMSGFGLLKNLLGGALGNIAKWMGISKAASVAGTAAGGYAAGKVGQEAAKQGAKRGLLNRGVRALGRGAWGAAKFAGRAAVWTAVKAVPWVARAAIGIVSAPVALAVGALTLVYYTTKYFRNRLKPMQKVRYTQYGLPVNDRDYWFPVAELENDLKGRVVFKEDGSGDFSGKLDWHKYLKYFKVDPQNARDVQRWGEWFNQRFKPVFLSHMSILKRLDPKCDIMEVDEKLHDAYKVDLAKESLFTRNSASYPYVFDASPFPGKAIHTGTAHIVKAINEVIKKYRKVKRPNVVSESDKTDNKPQTIIDDTKTATRPIDAAAEVAKVTPKIPSRDTSADTPKANPRLTGLNNPTSVATPTMAQYRAAKDKDVNQSEDRPLTAQSDQAHIRPSRRSLEAQVRIGAEQVGYDADKLVDIARALSGLQPSGTGLFGFTSDQWNTFKNEYFEKHGIKSTDKVINTHHEAVIAAEYFKGIEEVLAKMSQSDVSTRQLILAKKLGSPSAALSVLSANTEDPIARYVAKTAGVDDLNSILRDESGEERTVGSYLTYIDNLIAKRVTESLPKYMFERKDEPVDAPAQTPRNMAQYATGKSTTRTSISDAMVVRQEDTERKREIIARESMIAQQDYSRQSSTSLINATDILRSSLDVQRNMDKSLNQAVTHLAKLVALGVTGSSTSGKGEKEREDELLAKLEASAEASASKQQQSRGFPSILSMRRTTTT